MNRRDRAHKLGEIHRVMGALRQSEEGPDLTQSILSRVHEQREFIPPSTRRWVGRWRLVAAGCAATSALAVACAWRWAPESTAVVSKPTPVSNVLCVGCRAAESVQRFADTIERAGDAQPAEFLLAFTADVPAADDPRECAGRVASLPCPVPPCAAARQGLELPTEIVSISYSDSLRTVADFVSPLEDAASVSPGVWSILYDDSRSLLAASSAPVAQPLSVGSSDGGHAGRSPKPLAESLAPLLWGRPLRGSGVIGSGLPK